MNLGRRSRARAVYDGVVGLDYGLTYTDRRTGQVRTGRFASAERRARYIDTRGISSFTVSDPADAPSPDSDPADAPSPDSDPVLQALDEAMKAYERFTVALGRLGNEVQRIAPEVWKRGDAYPGWDGARLPPWYASPDGNVDMRGWLHEVQDALTCQTANAPR